MTLTMFDYLRKYIGKKTPPNRFAKLTSTEIKDAEDRLRMTFPNQLRAFYREIGHGSLSHGVEDDPEWEGDYNEILHPRDIASLLCDADNAMRPREGFREGVLPFCHVGECTYLMLRPKSEAPNRVYWPGGTRVISESIEEFFEELYRHAKFYHAMSSSTEIITGANHKEVRAGEDGVAVARDYGIAKAGWNGTAIAGYRGQAVVGDDGTAICGFAGEAAAGEFGTAIVGDYGVAIAGKYESPRPGAGNHGRARAGNFGVAIAGDWGSASAGKKGTAIVGEAGTAIVGEQGVAVAGPSGKMVFEYRDNEAKRLRLQVVYVGEKGVKPNTAYRFDGARKKIVKVASKRVQTVLKSLKKR